MRCKGPRETGALFRCQANIVCIHSGTRDGLREWLSISTHSERVWALISPSGPSMRTKRSKRGPRRTPTQVRERSRNMALVLEALQSAERDTPDYIELDPKGMSARYIRIPELAEVPYPVKMEPNLVVEYYAS